MKKIYKTAKGRSFDMQKFAENNGLVKAVGNTNMNGRGDILGKLGEIKITREQILNHPNRIKNSTTKNASLKTNYPVPDNFDTPAEIVKKVQTKRKESQFDSIEGLEHRENKRKKLK